MSRVAFVLAAVSLAAMNGPVAAAARPEPQVNAFGIPVAPQSGNASIKQWGGMDDQFAVNPDGDEAPAPKSHAHVSPPMAQNQNDSDADADANDPGDPDPDHFDEVLPI